MNSLGNPINQLVQWNRTGGSWMAHTNKTPLWQRFLLLKYHAKQLGTKPAGMVQDDLDSDAGSVHSDTWCFSIASWWRWDVDVDVTPQNNILWMGKWWYTNGFYGALFSDKPTFSLCLRKEIQFERSQVDAPIYLSMAVAIHFEGFGLRRGPVCKTQFLTRSM